MFLGGMQIKFKHSFLPKEQTWNHKHPHDPFNVFFKNVNKLIILRLLLLNIHNSDKVFFLQ